MARPGSGVKSSKITFQGIADREGNNLSLLWSVVPVTLVKDVGKLEAPKQNRTDYISSIQIKTEFKT